MASYFHVALTGPARTWLMNLTPGSVYSWEELCARFTANFTSAYQQHGVEAYLHAVRQEPGETLRAFISRFTKVRGTIPRISDASIITAFRLEVQDKKMLEKLATHDVETVTTLFTLADKCARAAEGRAWNSAPQTGVTRTGGSGATTQGGGKKKKNRGHDRPQSSALVAAVATGGRDERSKRPRQQGGDSGSCPVHPNSRHSALECREILKLAKRISERREQASKDGSPPRRRPGKEKVDEGDLAAGERDLGYQTPEQVLKDIITGDFDSSDDDDRHKKLYVMYSGSWELTSRRNVKSLASRGPIGDPMGSRKQLHISGGRAPLSPSGHPTAPKTWQGLSICDLAVGKARYPFSFQFCKKNLHSGNRTRRPWVLRVDP
jgi:hypothetical protein